MQIDEGTKNLFKIKNIKYYFLVNFNVKVNMEILSQTAKLNTTLKSNDFLLIIMLRLR